MSNHILALGIQCQITTITLWEECDLTLHPEKIQCQIAFFSWDTMSNHILVLPNTVSNDMIPSKYSGKSQILKCSVKSHFSHGIQCQIAFSPSETQCQIAFWRVEYNVKFIAFISSEKASTKWKAHSFPFGVFPSAACWKIKCYKVHFNVLLRNGFTLCEKTHILLTLSATCMFWEMST